MTPAVARTAARFNAGTSRFSAAGKITEIRKTAAYRILTVRGGRPKPAEIRARSG